METKKTTNRYYSEDNPKQMRYYQNDSPKSLENLGYFPVYYPK
ncbi:MAG: hypothetical protein AABX77_00230 [Nanoarchaeota archaeon]